MTTATLAASTLVSMLGWRGRDLPAQVLRIAVFRDGDWFWNPQWFAGHATLGYSLLLPALGALLGVTILGIAITTGAVAAFEQLVRDRPRATLATGAFAFAMVSNLVVGRLPFALGAAFALWAIVAHAHGKKVTIPLAICASLSSPLAALFLALAFAAWTIMQREWRNGALLGAAALGPAVTTSVLFGTGGDYPYPTWTFAWSFGLCVVVALVTETPVVRTGALLCGAVCVGAYVLSTPIGSNVYRMPLYLATPLVLLADPARTRRMLLVGPAIAFGIQSSQLVEVAASIDASTRPEYYAGVVHYLATRPEPVRVEIPATKQHWETAYVAEQVPIARGWERQIDRGLNPEFYDPVHPLDAEAYLRWLARTGVTHVAHSDALLDMSSLAEGALIERGLDYLRPVYTDPHWTV
ncbi:MAG: hypothetical protein ACT4OX_05015 [Actinomycetota bacterium]